MTLEAVGIARSFGEVRALAGVDVRLTPGRVVALLGDNGAGKSTLARILAGVETADAGSVRLDGRRLDLRSSRDAARAGIALVHQHPSLFPSLSVEENLALAPATDPAEAAVARRTVLDALAPDLDTRQPAGRLPLSSQLAVELTRSLSAPLRFLLLDEPTASLDPLAIEVLFAELRRRKDAGLGIALVTHRLPDVASMADEVIVLRRGRVALAARVDSHGVAGLSDAMSGHHAAPHTAATTPVAMTARRRPSPVARQAALELRDVPLRPGAHPLSFRVEAGEIFGVLGVDGNGQDELAEILRSRVAPAGELSVGSGSKARIGYLPADRTAHGIFPSLTGWENVLLGRISRSRWPGWIARRDISSVFEALTGRFELPPSATQRPAGTLSGGQQQRLLLARVLAVPPDILVAVNPGRGLDQASTARLVAELRSLAGRGIGVVVFLADPDEAATLCDRVGVLYRHRLVGVTSLQGAWRGRVAAWMAGVEEARASHLPA